MNFFRIYGVGEKNSLNLPQNYFLVLNITALIELWNSLRNTTIQQGMPSATTTTTTRSAFGLRSVQSTSDAEGRGGRGGASQLSKYL